MGAIRSTPMAAIETQLNLLPLDIFIKGEVRISVYRLNCSDSWRNLEHRHSRITSIITNPVLEMGSDYMLPKYSFGKPFDIQIDWGVGVKRKSNVYQMTLSGTQMGQKLTMDEVLEYMEKPQDMISTSHWGSIPRFSRLKYVQ
jgi:hypothetical protein